MVNRMRLLLACAVSAAVVLVSPFMGRIQAFLRSSLSTEAYVLILGVAVGGSILAAIVTAFVRIRDRRLLRFFIMAGACVTGLAYTTLMSTGDATIDAVERVHFVTYGLIAVLFYRVWRHAGDPSSIVLPMLCGFVVGTLDEWLQWFIPFRVGEMHDVLLNFTALACGVMFAVALEPPPAFTMRLGADGRARIGMAAAVAVLIFGGFVGVVHVGHELQVDGIGRFASRHTAAELGSHQRERASRWTVQPPIGISRLSREDQYLDEGLWHVRERNRLWDAGDFTGSWHENLILERFFTPILDLPTYMSPTGTRWPAEHRRDAEGRVVHLSGAQVSQPQFVSDAAPYPIHFWNKTAYWTAVLAAAALLAATKVLRPRGR